MIAKSDKSCRFSVFIKICSFYRNPQFLPKSAVFGICVRAVKRITSIGILCGTKDHLSNKVIPIFHMVDDDCRQSYKQLVGSRREGKTEARVFFRKLHWHVYEPVGLLQSGTFLTIPSQDLLQWSLCHWHWSKHHKVMTTIKLCLWNNRSYTVLSFSIFMNIELGIHVIVSVLPN